MTEKSARALGKKADAMQMKPKDDVKDLKDSKGLKDGIEVKQPEKTLLEKPTQRKKKAPAGEESRRKTLLMIGVAVTAFLLLFVGIGLMFSWSSKATKAVPMKKEESTSSQSSEDPLGPIIGPIIQAVTKQPVITATIVSVCLLALLSAILYAVLVKQPPVIDEEIIVEPEEEEESFLSKHGWILGSVLGALLLISIIVGGGIAYWRSLGEGDDEDGDVVKPNPPVKKPAAPKPVSLADRVKAIQQKWEDVKTKAGKLNAMYCNFMDIKYGITVATKQNKPVKAAPGRRLSYSNLYLVRSGTDDLLIFEDDADSQEDYHVGENNMQKKLLLVSKANLTKCPVAVLEKIERTLDQLAVFVGKIDSANAFNIYSQSNPAQPQNPPEDDLKKEDESESESESE